MKAKNNAKIAIVMALFWTSVCLALFGVGFPEILAIPALLFMAAFIVLCVITSGAKDDRE